MFIFCHFAELIH